MSFTIHLSDIPADGLTISQEILPFDIGLPSDDGDILGSIRCTGQIVFSDKQAVHCQGHMAGRIARECIRCLTSFEEDLSVPFAADFCKMATSSTDSTAPISKSRRRRGMLALDQVDDDAVDTEAYPITANQIDLVPALREHLILAAPLQPLCREDCQGLCQTCGVNFNEGQCGCHVSEAPSSLLDLDNHLSLHRKTTRCSMLAVPKMA